MKYLSFWFQNVNWKRTSGLWNWFLLSFLQISIPMSAEFEELMKARDNPSEEAQSEFKQHVLVLSQEHVCTTCKSLRTAARGANASWLFHLLQQQKWDLMRKLIESSCTALSSTLCEERLLKCENQISVVRLFLHTCVWNQNTAI